MHSENGPLAYNPSQSDLDHDAEGDACDLNDGLIYVLGTDDKNRVEWQRESGYTTWNDHRGSLSLLTVLDTDIPAPGEVAFNLVTGVAGGVDSSLGTNSAGGPRASANPCP